MMGTSSDNARLVAAAVTRYIGTKDSWPTSSGYGERIDLALINAVMSIQARFGRQLPDGSFNGVRGAVEKYRIKHQDLAGNWLETLAAEDEGVLVDLLTRSKFNGGKTKAAAIIEAAQAFVDAGLTSREAIVDDLETAERAYRSVKGLGRWTFEYLKILLGLDSVKSDVWVIRFVSRAVGREVSGEEAFAAVTGAAELLQSDQAALDHAIWSYARVSRLREMPFIQP